MTANTSPTVMVVDDDKQVRSLYTEYLRDEYTVVTAASGREALARLDASVDVVLLDRRMPGLSGSEVLERIRAGPEQYAVAMLTGVDPDFDIIEMAFDDYVVKPASRTELRSLVEQLRYRQEYDELVREYFALVSKIALLESEKSATELEESEEYADLLARLDEIKSDARDALDRVIDTGKSETLFYDMTAAD